MRGHAWAMPPVAGGALVVRIVDRLQLPDAHQDQELWIRFAGQRNFIRATRAQAVQAVAYGLGEVRVDRVVEREAFYPTA